MKRSAPHQAVVDLLGFLGLWRLKKRVKEILYFFKHSKAAVDHIFFLSRKIAELEQGMNALRSALLPPGTAYPLRHPAAAEDLLDGGVYALDPQADTNVLRALAEALTLQRALFHNGPGGFLAAGTVPASHRALCAALLEEGEPRLVMIYPDATPAEKEAAWAAAAPHAILGTFESGAEKDAQPFCIAGPLHLSARAPFGETLRRSLLALPSYHGAAQPEEPLIRRTPDKLSPSYFEA